MGDPGGTVEEDADPQVLLREERNFIPEIVDTAPMVPNGFFLPGSLLLEFMDPPSETVIG